MLNNKMSVENIELGNLLFGCSRGEYCFPNRDIIDSYVWRELIDKCNLDFYCTPLYTDYDFYGFDNDVFTVRPYCWSEEEEEMELPNFLYKPNGFEIRWYKYPFRNSYMNQDLSEKELLDIFKICLNSI